MLIPQAGLETDVLIIGSGPAGSSAALFLATYGVDHIVITKYRWTANTPRAHITNQRTVEAFRELARPDAHVAWRSSTMVTDPAAALESALRHILSAPSGAM